MLLHQLHLHGFLVLRPGRVGEGRLDLLSSARRHLRFGSWPLALVQWADALAARHGLQHHRIASRFGQLYRDDHPAPGSRHDLDADAVLLLGAVHHGVPAPARLPSAGSRESHAVHGSRGRHGLLHADRSGASISSSSRAGRAEEVRSSGSISFGSWRIPRCTCSFCPASAWSPKSSRTIPASRSTATRPWSWPCWFWPSSPSLSGPTICI